MCGIASAYTIGSDSPTELPVSLVHMMLLRLMNRGDLSTGIARYNPNGPNILDVKKGRGTPRNFFGEPGSFEHKKFLKSFRSCAAIGHDRYATSGSTDDATVEALSHPYIRQHNRKWKEYAFGFNGNITNLDELSKTILVDGDDYYLKTDGDTEYMRIFFSKKFAHYTDRPTIDDYQTLFEEFSTLFDGAYNITFLNSLGHMILIRDPYGFHPFSYGYLGDTLVSASEDSALRALGVEEVFELEPGTFLYTDGKTVEKRRFAPKETPKHCIFEYVYFMNAASTFAGRSVQRSRVSLGRKLAEKETLQYTRDTVTGPVPGTAIGMCDGYQHGAYKRTGKYIPKFDALVKVNQVRSFIADHAYGGREQVIRDKFDLTPDYLEKKEWIAVDDSLVRGSTSKQLIKYVKKACKAEKVHFRIASAPVRYPCFYGINMPTLDELAASGETPVEEVREKIGADSLRYTSVDEMMEAVIGSRGDLKKEDFCLGCFTGKYPTKGGRKCLMKLKKEMENK